MSAQFAHVILDRLCAARRYPQLISISLTEDRRIEADSGGDCENNHCSKPWQFAKLQSSHPVLTRPSSLYLRQQLV